MSLTDNIKKLGRKVSYLLIEYFRRAFQQVRTRLNSSGQGTVFGQPALWYVTTSQMEGPQQVSASLSGLNKIDVASLLQQELLREARVRGRATTSPTFQQDFELDTQTNRAVVFAFLLCALCNEKVVWGKDSQSTICLVCKTETRPIKQSLLETLQRKRGTTSMEGRRHDGLH